MKKVKINKRGKVLLYQYGGIFLLSASGFFWNMDWVMAKFVTAFLIGYGIIITANGYKQYGEFLKIKWKVE